ncbi:MAG: extracellular solute-binding protein [Bellilinea sp.]
MPLQSFFTRRINVFISIAVIVVMVSGCQSTGDPTLTSTANLPAPSVTTVQEPTPVPPTPTVTPIYLVPEDQLKGLPINFFHPWTGDLSTAVEKLVAEFNQVNEWGIQVTAVSSGSSMALAETVENGSDGELMPQVVLAPSEHLLTWLDRENRIRPLNDFIADPVLGLSEQARVNFPLVFWQQDQQGGMQAGIPAQRDTPVIFYNQTWASELGFNTPPATIDAFKEQACAAADINSHDRFAANDGTGGWIVNTDGQVVYSWLMTFGLENALAGDPFAFNFNQPATEQAFTFLRSMVDEGCAWFARSTASNEYFAGRQALMVSGSLTDLSLQAKTQERLESTDVWTILPYPDGDQAVSVTSGLSFGVLVGTPQQELASWLFVRWMSQPENNVQLLLAGGGLPVNNLTAELAEEQMDSPPAWAESIAWIPSMKSTPTAASWRIARFVLQDAFWYAMQSSTTVEDIPLILEQLDATIAEVESVQGQ